MSPSLVAIVMAAGKGTRMKSDLPKVLHEVAGEPLLGHVLLTLRQLETDAIYVIVGHGAEQVRAFLPENVTPVEQLEQLGTGHAVDQVTPFLDQYTGDVLILSGDVPLLTAETLRGMKQEHEAERAVLTMLSTTLNEPTGYGRIVRDETGRVTGVVEQKDATPAQKAITECNLGTYLASWPHLRDTLAKLTPNNAQGEYYLTDAIAHLVHGGHGVVSHCTSDALEGEGVNTRAQLAKLQGIYQQRTAEFWMAAGVTIVNPHSTIIGPKVSLGVDTILEPGTILLGETKVGERCVIGAYSQLRDVTCDDDVHILHSYLSQATVGRGSHVGPYAHLRQGAQLGKKVRLGNFVEVKKSVLKDGAKAAHLAYLGDAEVGCNVNIGCGVITVNYDGKKKSPTVIRDNAFVGSNSNLIAPVTIGEAGFVAAGSTITQDVPAGALAIGRGRQVTKEGWVAQREENALASSP
ncbi:MAG: bifunctional UDP-N-acetylglucosamine diphosphorylase/glucosamine-1-phosphate N-acetyltransferase GlmU [Candidatus Sericytochromatia bacterium]|nr:bifunctional UDP-N-acetylglucosamine diphosphorylase/glucosamine-1-phosphate N-acetyltransferase GlmU [Candidatus Sericytochromatia bacterium]